MPNGLRLCDWTILIYDYVRTELAIPFISHADATGIAEGRLDYGTASDTHSSKEHQPSEMFAKISTAIRRGDIIGTRSENAAKAVKTT